MKRKLKAIFLMLFLIAGTFRASAQATLSVNRTDGGQQSFELSSLKSVTFGVNAFSLNLKDETKNSFDFPNVKTITFSGVTSGITTLANASKSISIYPTSAREQIYLANLPEGESKIVIFRTDGTVVLQTRVSNNGEAISVSSLSGGFYLLKVNNQILKFYKL